jgi:uncharacterized protein YybS (DUF2232 family)
MQVIGTFIQPAIMKDILTGIFLCLTIITAMYIMPVIGIFAWIFLPLPVLFYRLKAGRNGSGIIMAASLMVLIVFTRNFAFDILYFGSLLMAGFFLGEGIERHLSIERIILTTCLAVFGICLAVLMVYASYQTQGFGRFFSDYLSRYHTLSAQLFSDSARLYPEMKLDPRVLERASSLFVFIFPGIFINSFLTMTWVNILFIKKILSKKGIVVKSIENLNQWRTPDFLIFGVIALSGFILVPVDALKLFAVNGLIILMFVYFFQGIAVVSFFFQKKRAPFALRFFLYILIAIQPIFMFLVIGCGLFDTWINFRKLGTAAQ